MVADPENSGFDLEDMKTTELLLSRIATVDGRAGSGHEAGSFGGQEDRNWSQLLRITPAGHRDFANHTGVDLRVVQ